MRILSILLLTFSLLFSVDITPTQLELAKAAGYSEADIKKGLESQDPQPNATNTKKEQQVVINNITNKNEAPKKERYGSQFFKNLNTINPYSIPTPNNYYMNYGDQLSLKVYGSQNKNFSLTLDNNGNVQIPNIEDISIVGKKFENVKNILLKEVEKAYPNSTNIDISITKYSPIQVVITGLVETPGIYNLPSFSTIKDALMISGGILSDGSYRNISLKRNGKVIKAFDLYQLILYGDLSSDVILKNGDVIFVNPIEKNITISGDVKKATTYELKRGETFKQLFKFTRGFKINANTKAIKLKRYENNGFNVYNLTLNELYKITPKDEDSLFVYSKEFIDPNFVTLNGHIAGAGEKRIPKDKMLSSLLKNEIKKYGKENYFKRFTNFDYVSISNIQENRTYNLQKVLDGKTKVRLKKGDKITIYSEYLVKPNTITIKGYITGTGDKTIPNDKKLSTLLKSEIDKYTQEEYFLENTNFTYATIENKEEEEFKNFNLQDVLDGKAEIILKKEDIVTIYKDNSLINDFSISVRGSIVEDKDLNFNGYITIPDLFKMINIQGNPEYLDKSKIKVSRIENLKNVDIPVYKDEFASFQIKEFDTITFFDIKHKIEENKATIKGEVYFPGQYKVSKDTRLKDIVNFAGGFTKKVLYEKFEIVRYNVKYSQRERVIMTLDLKRAMEQNPIIKEDDEITIFPIANWNKKKYVEIKGQIRFPGRYPVEDGEKLSSVLQRAGGFTKEAFVEGIVFTREEVKALQQKSLDDSIAQLEGAMLQKKLDADDVNENANQNSELDSIYKSIKLKAELNKPIGRIALKFSRDLEEFKKTENNITLKDRDTIYVPEFNDTVTVVGEVLNQNTFVYNSNLDVQDYIARAGGLKDSADEDKIYVIKADGTAMPQRYSFFFGEHSSMINKGDTVVVPFIVDTTSDVSYMKDVVDVLYKLAITAASLKTVGSI